MSLDHVTEGSQSQRGCLVLGLFLAAALLVVPGPGEATVEGIPCTPEPTDMPIAYGDLVICQIDSIGDTDVFRFQASAGEVVAISASRQSGGTPCVELFDPDGTRVGTQQCNYYGARIDSQLTKSGMHAIRVSEYDNNATMAYALSLERTGPVSASAAALAFGQGTDTEINPIGDVDLYKFDGAVGDTVTLLTSRQSGGTPCVELFDPDGTRVGTQQCNYYGARIDSQLAKAGMHAIRVSEYDNNEVMVYRVDLQCVGQCASLAFTTIAITLTGCATCRAGDVFSARASVSNPTSPTPRWLEVKSGVFLPDRTPVNLLGNPHLDLPPGFTFDGEVFRLTLPTGLPAGTYQFCGLLLERELGEPVAKSCQTFTIGP